MQNNFTWKPSRWLKCTNSSQSDCRIQNKYKFQLQPLLLGTDNHNFIVSIYWMLCTYLHYKIKGFIDDLKKFNSSSWWDWSTLKKKIYRRSKLKTELGIINTGSKQIGKVEKESTIWDWKERLRRAVANARRTRGGGGVADGV